MPEENEELNELDPKEIEKQQNIENNSELAKTAIIAGATVYGGKVGQAVASKVVDTKLGQKVTHKAGEKIEEINQHVPGGEMAQNITNASAESGAFNAANQYFKSKAGSFNQGNTAKTFNQTGATGYQKNQNFSPKNLNGIKKSDLNSVNSKLNNKLGPNQFSLKSLFKMKEKKSATGKRLFKGRGRIGLKILILFGPAIFVFILIILFMLLLTSEDEESGQLDYDSNSSASNSAVQRNSAVGNIVIDVREIDEKQILFIGDLRTINMIDNIETTDVPIIADKDANYNWYIDVKETIEETLNSGNISYVVFNLGFNDLSNIDSYINAFNSLKSKYSNITFYYMSINPIDEELAMKKGYNITTDNIESFNQKLSNTYGNNFIDSYNWIDSIETTDGIHYNKDTSLEIYNIIINYLKTY